MKLWKLKGARKLTMEETPATALTSGMVKVKVEEVLFSSLDYSIYSGEIKRKYPFVMGRNAVGVISDVYDKKQSMFKKMDRVVVEPYIPCNNCDECLKQDYENCTELKYMGQNSEGLLRNFVDVSINQVHRLPENLSYEEALWVPHVAFCLNIVDALNVEKGRHVAIFSSTKTGIILAQLLLYYQGVPILVSDNESLLKNARELGIFYCLDSKKVNVEQEILTITGGRMCREVVLFSDSDFSVKNVYSAAAPNATICLAQRRGQLLLRHQFAGDGHRQGGKTAGQTAEIRQIGRAAGNALAGRAGAQIADNKGRLNFRPPLKGRLF